MREGTIAMYAGSTVPSGYLQCDGSAVSRTTYSELFAAIGTAYGPGDGSTTFNLPDIAGRVLIGQSLSHAIGTTGGSETASVSEAQLPSHTHSVPSHGHGNTISAATPELSHTVGQPAYNYNQPGDWKYVYNGSSGGYMGTQTATASRTTNVTVANHPASDCTMTGGITPAAAFDTDAAGGGQAHNNMQPYITMIYVISTGVA